MSLNLFDCLHDDDIDQFKELLNNIDINPSILENALFRSACIQGKTPFVELLLNDSRVNPNDASNEAIILACKNGHTDVVKILLQDSRILPFAKRNQPLRLACQYNHTEIIKLLLADKRVDPSIDNNRIFSVNAFQENLVAESFCMSCREDGDHPAICYAAQNGNDEIVELLLRDSRVNPAIHKNLPFRVACEYGRIAVAKILLNDSRVNPFDMENDALYRATVNDHIDIIRLLFTRSIDGYKRVISNASKKIQKDVAELLLLLNIDFRDALLHACYYDKIDIIKGLLIDDRVNTSHNCEILISEAYKYQNTEIIRYMLYSKKVDPSFNNNEGIKMAIKYYNREMAFVLLQYLSVHTDEVIANPFILNIIEDIYHKRHIWSMICEKYGISDDLEMYVNRFCLLDFR